MKLNGLLIALAAMLLFSLGLSSQSRISQLERHVGYLASDSLRGRAAGSEDAAKAAAYILGQYKDAGLQPFFKEGWTMPFRGGRFQNVVGWIEGSDPVLRNEYIVLGAHYDHLGIKGGVVYNGADDNASGSAALIEVAKELAAHRESLKRSVIVAAFDAEELGLWGSQALAERLDSMVGASNIKLMMSIDMVGWLHAGKALTLEGVATIRDGKRLLENEAGKIDLPIKGVNYEKSIFTATDTEYFAKKQIPTLAVTTGLKSPYHKPEDDADLIDYGGLDQISEYLGNIAVRYASDPSVTPSGKVARKHSNVVRPVVFGTTLGIGTSNIDFKDAAFVGKTAFSVEAGLGASFFFDKRGLLSLRAEALCEWANCRIPDGNDFYGSSLIYNRRSLVVPVNLVLHTPFSSTFGAYIGIGGYWSEMFRESLSAGSIWRHKPTDWEGNFTVSEYGSSFVFGFEVGPVGIEFSSRSALSGFFEGDRSLQEHHLVEGDAEVKSHTIKANREASFFTLRYIF